MEDLALVFEIAIVGLSVLTVWLTWRIYRYNRLSRAWLAVVWAFVLVIFRRAVSSGVELGLLPASGFYFWFEKACLLAISLLYIVGFRSMLRNFERFEVISRDAKKAVKTRRRK